MQIFFHRFKIIIYIYTINIKEHTCVIILYIVLTLLNRSTYMIVPRVLISSFVKKGHIYSSFWMTGTPISKEYNG